MKRQLVVGDQVYLHLPMPAPESAQNCKGCAADGNDRLCLKLNECAERLGWRRWCTDDDHMFIEDTEEGRTRYAILRIGGDT